MTAVLIEVQRSCCGAGDVKEKRSTRSESASIQFQMQSQTPVQQQPSSLSRELTRR